MGETRCADPGSSVHNWIYFWKDMGVVGMKSLIIIIMFTVLAGCKAECKYTLQDVPEDYEIVKNGNVYRARFKSNLYVLSTDSTKTSLCDAIERAVEQNEYSKRKREQQNLNWEVVR